MRGYLKEPSVAYLPGAGRGGGELPGSAARWGPYPYLWLDALTQKVREAGRTVNVSVVVATAVDSEGRREIIGMDVGTSEDGAFWLAFLRSLSARGLGGVKLVVSVRGDSGFALYRSDKPLRHCVHRLAELGAGRRSDVEAGAFRWMKNIGSTRVASSVVSLGWVEDGIDEIEVKAIENVSYIADKNAEEALRIVGMPFLESIGRECTSHNDIWFMLEADPRKSNVGTEEFLES